MNRACANCLDAALNLAARGLPVFPCGADKKPLTDHGFKDATTDEAQIREWWARWPEALIGMPTGPASNLVVLDVDMDLARGKDGEASLRALLAQHEGTLPDTRTARTPRGGRHLYFRHPGPGVKVTTRTDWPAPALDVRGDGGYVIVPPSQAPAGAYAWIFEPPSASLPDWLRELLVEKPTAGGAALPPAKGGDDLERACAALRFIPAADRTLWRDVGFALKARFGETGWPLFDEWSRTAPEHYDERENLSQWQSFKPDGGITIGTLFHHANQNGRQPERPRYKPGSVANEYLGADIEPAVWGEPKPLPGDLPAVQPFNFDCLPGTLRPWLEDISDRMQCPPDYPAVGATIALGSIIGRKVGIRPKRQDDWLVVPNLWGMAVGRPGWMKTPALEQALAPLNRLVAEALAKYEAETGAHKVSAMLGEQRAKLAERAIRGLLKDGNEKGARDLAESNLKQAETAPVLRRYEVNDSTVEKLGELLNQNPNGLLLHRDELVGFLRSLDKEGREDSRAFFLEAWNGTGDFTSDRIGRGTVRIEAVTVSIIGAIQPGPLSDYLRQAVRSGVGDDGLLQRFQLAVWPDTSKEWRNVDRWPDTAAKNETFAVFQHLDALSASAAGAVGVDGIPFLRFSSGAQERFDLWRAELERILRSDCDHPAFEAHLAKYRKLIPALALILHLANRDTGPVTLAALEKALLWANYLESHARRIYSAVLRPDAAAARELAKHLQRGDLADKFTLREAYRKGWTGLASKEDAEAATEILCELGWIRPVHSASPATGRPACQSFEVHPKICEIPATGTDKTDRTAESRLLSVLSVASGPDVENSSAPEIEPELVHADLI